MTDQPRCPSCYRVLVVYACQLSCTRCGTSYPVPATGKVGRAIPVVYEQAEALVRVLKEEVANGQNHTERAT